MRCRSIGRVFQDDGALKDWRVGIARHGDVMPAGVQAFSERGGEGNQPHLRVAGVDVLSRLRNVFRSDKFWFELIVKSKALERRFGSASIRRVLSIGDGNGLQRWIAQSINRELTKGRVIARP